MTKTIDQNSEFPDEGLKKRFNKEFQKRTDQREGETPFLGFPLGEEEYYDSMPKSKKRDNPSYSKGSD